MVNGPYIVSVKVPSEPGHGGLRSSDGKRLLSFLEVFQLLSKKLLQFSFRTEEAGALKHTFRGYPCSVMCF